MYRIAVFGWIFLCATTAYAVDPRVRAGLLPPSIAEGARLFFTETFAGNGRTCGTCHPAAGDLTVSPAEAQARFNASGGSDPLFAPNVPGLELPSFLRSAGLVLENVDGFSTFTLRAIPHTFSMAATIVPPPGPGPAHRTGWSGDGAPPPSQLRDFPTGAVIQHFTKSLARRVGVDFRLPTDLELSVMDAYMRSVGRLNEPNLAAVGFLDAAAARGRGLFLGTGRCDTCHRNAGALSSSNGSNGNFDTDTVSLSPPGVPLDDGLGTPGDGSFNTPSLIEAADTAPFFHNHGALTLERAVRFFTTPTFAASPSGRFLASRGTPIVLTEAQVLDIAVMLRVLNAVFNLRLAAQSVDAALRLDFDPAADARKVENGLITAGRTESLDASRVLTERGLGLLAQIEIQQALAALQQAAPLLPGGTRRQWLGRAIAAFQRSEARLVTGFDLRIGQGTIAQPF